MLGRLARWLRLLGYDTLYYPRIEDSRLLRIAREDERILLTRDTRLVQVRGMKNYLLLTENDTFAQLKKVLTAFSLVPSGKTAESLPEPGVSRCSLCNTVLNDVPKEQAEGRVPEYVYLTREHFRKCGKCDKFYWEGTHQEKLKRKLSEIL